MIIFLSELQKEHLAVLHQQPKKALVDFCKLAIEFLNNGPNDKKYNMASDKLNMHKDAVKNLVHAIVYLIVEGSKHNLSEHDFTSSLILAGFSSEQQDVLLKLYSTKRTELSEALCFLQRKDPVYQNLSWRLEVQVASRRCEEIMKPIVLLDIVLMTSKNYGHYSREKSKKLSDVHIDVTVQEAKAASQCQNVINHVLVRCDLPNLVHLTNKLEQALKESKSAHVRKIQRVLQ